MSGSKQQLTLINNYINEITGTFKWFNISHKSTPGVHEIKHRRNKEQMKNNTFIFLNHWKAQFDLMFYRSMHFPFAT